MSLSKTESQKLADAARTSQDAEELKQIAKNPNADDWIWLAVVQNSHTDPATRDDIVTKILTRCHNNLHNENSMAVDLIMVSAAKSESTDPGLLEAIAQAEYQASLQDGRQLVLTEYVAQNSGLKSEDILFRLTKIIFEDYKRIGVEPNTSMNGLMGIAHNIYTNADTLDMIANERVCERSNHVGQLRLLIAENRNTGAETLTATARRCSMLGNKEALEAIIKSHNVDIKALVKTIVELTTKNPQEYAYCLYSLVKIGKDVKNKALLECVTKPEILAVFTEMEKRNLWGAAGESARQTLKLLTQVEKMLIIGKADTLKHLTRGVKAIQVAQKELQKEHDELKQVITRKM